MRRGNIVIVAIPGDFGKPRPALVIQSDRFAETGSVTVLLMSGTIRDAPLFRITVEPTPENGLRRLSQVMVDKVMSIKREKVRETIGRLEDETLVAVNRLLALFLGFA